MKNICYIAFLLVFGCNGNEPKKVSTDTFPELSIIDQLIATDKKLDPPQAGEWLYVHKEPGQTFQQYVNIKPVTPFEEKKLIYLQPIGQFSKQQMKIIDYTAEYTELFFGLKVVIAPVISDKIIPIHSRRDRDNGTEQLLTKYILDSLLAKQIPKDAIVIMAITEKDLYPSDDWNFVFGQAYTTKRIGVSSIFRYSETPIDSLNYNLCLNRLIKTSCHEIGHMFSVLHCTFANCIMNGSNSLYESDTRPNKLCSECLKKLYWNLKFNNRKRLEAIRDYFKKHKLESDYNLIVKDLEIIESKSLAS